MSKFKDLITGICGLIFSVALYALSVQIGLKENTTIGADFLPKIAAVVMLFMFAIVTYRGAVAVKNGVEEAPRDYKSNYLGVVIIFAAMIAYAMLLKPVGFIITSMVFLLLAIVLMTKKEELKPVLTIVITVVAVLFIYFVFTKVFGVRLPKGILKKL